MIRTAVNEFMCWQHAKINTPIRLGFSRGVIIIIIPGVPLIAFSKPLLLLIRHTARHFLTEVNVEMAGPVKPAILLHIAIISIVTLDWAPKMILTKDKKYADQNKEVVHLVVEPEETVVMFDAVTFE